MKRTRLALSSCLSLALTTSLPISAAPLGIEVVKGKPAQSSVFYWQVGILIAPPSQTRATAEIHCGGVLISPRHVLTAAHCVDKNREDLPQRGPYLPYAPGELTVVVNATNIRTDGAVHAVRSITPHPRWKQPSALTSIRFDFDAAILELEQPVTGRPIRISRLLVGPNVGLAWVSGWGLTEAKQTSLTLRAAPVPIVDTSACVENNGYKGSVTNQMLCAGAKAGGSDSCQGDSGGPLVVGSLDTVQLVGLVSWGAGCGEAGKYGVYTRMSQILDWVGSATGGAATFTSQQPGQLFDITGNGPIS